ncbi:hypothetical protein AB4K20DRAFT_1905341 [Rhizopus microsporus]|uniref:Uncharacterized protein n=1 Tax=Rhizopus microsporus TaxID=58291 RepID=A0A1X0RKH2_RHIZD|nr:hypothetical protein BCV71DRAFT_87147 [Rhizopus microsporus]
MNNPLFSEPRNPKPWFCKSLCNILSYHHPGSQVSLKTNYHLLFIVQPYNSTLLKIALLSAMCYDSSCKQQIRTDIFSFLSLLFFCYTYMYFGIS